MGTLFAKKTKTLIFTYFDPIRDKKGPKNMDLGGGQAYFTYWK